MEEIVRTAKIPKTVSGAQSNPRSPLMSGPKSLNVEESDASDMEFHGSGDQYDDEFEKF